ncbi:hypothetical protein GCM10027062_22380 [Nocardioides hungaricus]
MTTVTDLEFMVDEGRSASADRFFRAGSDLLTLLDEMTDVPVDWVIADLHLGSAVARISTVTDDPVADAALESVVAGLQIVEGGGLLPEIWGPDAIAAARRLSAVVDPIPEQSDSPGRARLTLIGGNHLPSSRTVELTTSLAGRLADLQPFERRMPGSVRGRLVGMNISRGNRASLREPTGRIVRVTFGNELRVPIRDALLEDVELGGDLRQDADGRVFQIRAYQVRTLPSPRMRWTALFAADPDITAGVTVDEYLERSRGSA